MDRNRITRTGARAPGVERLGSLARRCLTRASSLTQSRKYTVKAVGTKDEGKPEVGQAPSDIPALKPYWGKPAVRNFRGGNGNVGIIRSPVRAIALPDYRKGVANHLAPSLALLPRGTQRSVEGIGGVGDRASKRCNPDADVFVMRGRQQHAISALC